jgi:DNA-binding PadR family transcriptional regulator
LLLREHFEEHPETCCADAYYSLSLRIESINEERAAIGERPFKRPNYSSFSRYFHSLFLLRLIERTGKVEASVYPFLHKRVFYRLTDRGKAEVRGWRDPVKALHPEFR